MRKFRLSSMLIVLLLFFLITTNASAEGVIQLPKTGQTTSYYPGDDGALQKGVALPSPRFTDNGDLTIADNLTGLIWVKDANLMKTRNPDFDTDFPVGDGRVTWQHALDYVKKLNDENYLGHNDWHLPNVNEMRSMVDYSKNSPSLPQGHPFTNVQSYNYWSSSSEANPFFYYAWVVYMPYGFEYSSHKDNAIYVWPVRSGQVEPFVPSVISLPQSGQTKCYASETEISCSGTGQDGDIRAGVAWPNPRFTDHNNGTVTDNLTGLMWTKDANLPNGLKTWQQSLDYVANLNSASTAYGNGYYGYTDWRLPNINELKSIIDYSKNYQSFPQGMPFTNVQSSYYWSSSTYATQTDSAWYVNMYPYGVVSHNLKSLKNSYVWPVRGGQTETPTAISLSLFAADVKNKKVTLKWQTATEIDNLGFNILRSESETGLYTKINKKLIKAKGSSTKGASYKFKDKNIESGKTYWYKLEDIDSKIGAAQHDAVKVEVTAKKIKAKK